MSLRMKRSLGGVGNMSLTSRSGAGRLAGVSVTGVSVPSVPIEVPLDPIVYDGLLLNLDAGNTNSYPGSGTTWFDLANNYDATLVNGPTYSADNDGSILVDTTDDRFSFSTAIPIAANSGFSFCSFMKVSVFPGTSNPGLWRRGFTGISDWIIFQTTNRRPWVRWNGGDILQPASGYALTVGSWVHIALVIESAQRVRFYANGVEEYNVTHARATAAMSIDHWGYQYSTDYKIPGNYAVLQMYSRALTADEVTQNFNAHKSRYGL